MEVKDYCKGAAKITDNGSQAPTRARYKAAIAEFDLLWETRAATQCPDRMRQLLIVIEAFEEALNTKINLKARRVLSTEAALLRSPVQKPQFNDERPLSANTTVRNGWAVQFVVETTSGSGFGKPQG
jgi:hypothetical protein